MRSEDRGGDPPPRSSPCLFCLRGSQRGRTIPLTGQAVTIGRSSTCDICIHDPHVSRCHARIEPVDGGFMIVDLKSRNGTLVNDCPIREHRLEDGDEIRIENHRYVFLAGSPQRPGRPPEAVLAGEETDAQRAITIHARLPAGTPPLSLIAEGALDAAAVHRLLGRVEALQQMADVVIADVEPPVRLQRLANLLRETFHAECTTILLAERDTGRPVPAATALSPEAQEGPFALSETIVRKVASERVSLLCQDALSDAALREARSVPALQIRSVMCTPLVCRERFLGLLYVDDRAAPNAYDQQDLWLLRVMATPLAVLLDNADRANAVRRQLLHLRERVEQVEPSIIGQSSNLRDVLAVARKAADTGSTILILGESGTGKEVLARSIHRWSPRAEAPFVVVNCAALSEQLLQSDLFGHERGAFTGAVRQKRGRLELANGGTVFLDEIGEIDPGLQAKMLRFLQEREFERVGGTESIRVDVRIIAASNRDLAAQVEAGRFREDLYYRLRVVEVEMPPLRERPADIPLLAEAFRRECARETGRQVRGFSPEALERLRRHAWPGNVRELRNAIERAVVLCEGEHIEARDLQLGRTRRRIDPGDSGSGYHQQVRELKRQVIRAALDQSKGRRAAAAKLLGIQPSYLSRLMRNLEIR